MQVIIRQADAKAKTDAAVIAVYDDHITIEAAEHGAGVVLIKDVPRSKLTLQLGADQTPRLSLDGQWLAQNRPQKSG